MVVLYDPRTDTADLVAAAALVTPTTINLMAHEGRGMIAVALTTERCDTIGVQPMSPITAMASGDRAMPNLSIEARIGVSTGISAADRAATVLTAAVTAHGPQDLVTPGHVVPLRAVPGGVLARRGRVEAAVDALALTGLTPAAVLCDLLAADGELARYGDVLAICSRLGLELLSFDDVLSARLDAWT